MIRGGLRATRGRFTLDATFGFPATGVTGLFGRSGCGKSTLLRAIAGLLPDARGRLSIGDAVLQDSSAGILIPPHRRRIGMVFQHAALFPHLSVDGNIAFALDRRTPDAVGMSRSEIVELTEVEHLLDRQVHSLSGGERQRVAIARALASAPQLLLMDEPLSSLDRDGRNVLLPAIREMTSQLAIPVLYVSHSPEEVSSLAAQVLLMDAGRITATVDGPAFATR